MLTTLLLAVPAAAFVLVLATGLHAAAVRRRYPPPGRAVDAGGGRRLQVLERGDGMPVVFLHGAGGNMRDWTATIFDDVAARHRAIAVDRPGHGWSPRGGDVRDPRAQAERLRRALAAAGVERPVLVGHSWGAAVALAYAAERPDETGGVLLVAGVSHPWPGGVAWHYRAGARPLLGPLLAWTLLLPAFLLGAQRAATGVFAPNRPPADYVARAGLALHALPWSFVANARDVAHLKRALTEMAPDYGRITAPVIAVAGDSDGVVRTDIHTIPLPDAIEGAEVRILAGIGHMPHHAAPETVLAAIDDLAERVCSSVG